MFLKQELDKIHYLPQDYLLVKYWILCHLVKNVRFTKKTMNNSFRIKVKVNLFGTNLILGSKYVQRELDLGNNYLRLLFIGQKKQLLIRQ